MIQHQSMLQWAALTQHVSSTTVNVHTTQYLCAKKYDFLQFWNRIFTIKMWGNSRFILTDGYNTVLQLWSFTPLSQKWIRLLKLPSYLSFKTLSFSHAWFSMAVTCLYNMVKIYTSSLRNAWWTDLEASSDLSVSNG